MIINLRLIGGVAVGALGLSAAGPAFAGSADADAYTASISQNMDVLAKSSAMAADKSSNVAIKAYAAHEFMAGDATAVATADTTDVPTIVAANMTGFATDETGLQTARSADAGAVVDPTIYAAPLGAGVIMPTGMWAMSYLGTTSGKGFDWTYKAVQEDALTTLAGFTMAYSKNGDDPALRAAAIGQLPKIEARLAELRNL